MELTPFRSNERSARFDGVCRLFAVAGLALLLSACGGGGGGGGNNPPTVGSVAVTVKDLAGYVVPGATVVASVSNGTRTGTTDVNGAVTLTDVNVGNGTLAVSRDTFKPASVAVRVANSQTTSVAVALERQTTAAGGVLSVRVPAGGLAPDGKSLEFAIQVVVVDQASNAITGLQAAAFPMASVSSPAR
jgi:hypothetical protein